MKIAPSGRGMWITRIGSCEKGDPVAIANQLTAHGFTWLAVKSGDTTITSDFKQRFPSLVSACKSIGLYVYTWNYSTPRDTDSQVAQIRECLALGADGHIVDAEVEWRNRAPDADRFAHRLLSEFPDTWLAHAPMDLPAWHPDFPYAQFGILDAVMPQAYWTIHGSQGAKYWLNLMDAQWSKWPNVKLMPIGVTYGKGSPFDSPSGALDKDDLELFLSRYPDCSFWDYDAAMPIFWESVSG